MAENFDELQIVIEAEAQKAKSELDQLVEKITKTQQALVGTINTASGLGASFARSASNASAGSSNAGVKKIQKSFVDATKNADIFKNKVAEVRSKVQDLGKSYASDPKFSTVEKISREIDSLTAKIDKTKDKALFEKATSKGFEKKVNDVARYEGQIDSLKAKLAELSGAVKEVDFSNVSIHGEGFENELDSLAGAIIAVKQNIKDAFSGDFADYSDMIEGLKENRETMLEYAETIERSFTNDVDIVDRLDEAIAHLTEKANDALKLKPSSGGDSQLNQYSERMQAFEGKVAEARGALKGFWTDFANVGNRFTSIDEIKEKIDELVAKIYELKNKSLLEDSTGAKFEKNASVVAMYEEQIDSLKTKMQELSASERLAENSVSDIGVQAESAERKVYTLTDILSSMKRIIAESPANLFERIDLTKPKQEFTELRNGIEETEDRLEKLNKRMQNGYNRSGAKFEKTSTFHGLKADIEEAEIALVDYNKRLAEMGTHTHEVNWDGVGKRGKDAFDIVRNAVNKLISVVGRLGNAVSNKISNGFKSIVKNANNLDVVAKKLSKSILRVSNMLRLMVIRMALRGVINEAKAGFQDLIAFSDKTANSYNKIRNAIRYLADSLAALTAPLLNASSTFGGLGNIIDVIADKVVDLVNKINQLTSALLGHSTWIKATKQATNYAEAATEAGKAAKGALQGFDELNNLSSNQGGSGSGGSGAGGAQYEELPIDQKWTDIAEWLKEQWEKSDFTALGTLLGEKLRDTLNSIPWDEKIKPAAEKFGKSLGTLLNGFVEVPGLAESIGTTVAEAVNAGVLAIKGFVDVTHFDSIGRFIGISIVTAIRNIDWETIKGTAGDLGTKLAEGLNAFFDTGVLSEIGMAVGESLTAGINLWYNFVGELDFSELGRRIKNGIVRFLDTMSTEDIEGLSAWSKLGTAISESIVGTLKTVNIVLGDEETRKKISKAISDFLDSITWRDIYDGIMQLGNNIIEAVKAVISGVFGSERFKTEGLSIAIDASLLGISIVGGVALAKTLESAVLAAIGGSIAIKATLVVAIGAIGWKIGNKVYEVLDQKTLDMTIGEQISYIANTSIGEATYAIKMMLTDKDGNPLTKYGNNVLANMIPGGGVVNAVVNLTSGNIDEDLKWWKNNTTIGKKIDLVKGSIDTLISDIMNSKTYSVKVSATDVGNTVKAIWDLLSKIGEFCKNPTKFIINAVFNDAKTGTIDGVVKKFFGGDKPQTTTATIDSTVKETGDGNNKPSSFLKNIWDKFTGSNANKNATLTVKQNGAKAEDIERTNTAINKFPKGKKAKKNASLNITQSITHNGSPVKVNELVKGSTGMSSLASEWKKLPKSGTATLTATASWKNGTKKDLEDQMNNAGLKVDVTAQIKSVSYAASQQHINAGGGVFKLGDWHNINKFAAGGIPDQGQMFIAREAGPELVGTMGGATAVMNNDQIVSSVSDGVYKAVVAAMSGIDFGTNVTLEGDAGKIFRVVQKQGNDYQRRTGNPVFA